MHRRNSYKTGSTTNGVNFLAIVEAHGERGAKTYNRGMGALPQRGPRAKPNEAESVLALL